MTVVSYLELLNVARDRVAERLSSHPVNRRVGEAFTHEGARYIVARVERRRLSGWRSPTPSRRGCLVELVTAVEMSEVNGSVPGMEADRAT